MVPEIEDFLVFYGNVGQGIQGLVVHYHLDEPLLSQQSFEQVDE